MSRLFSSGYASGSNVVPRHQPPLPQRSAPEGHAPRHPVIPDRRAVVVELHPRLRIAIEHALLGEGYRVVDGQLPGSEEPVILFAGDKDGLHVFEAHDVAGALTDLHEGSGPPGRDRSPALGVHAFVPRPFGVADVLRVALAVGGFDRRRRATGP